MIHFLAFSKNRRMQFRAMCESLNHYINPNGILVITPNKYEGMEDIQNIQWIEEKHSFDNTIRQFINSTDLADNDKIVFNTDDLIYLKTFNPQIAANYLDDNSNVCGFSFRLGGNILWFEKCAPFVVSKYKDNNDIVQIVKYFWPGKPSHYGYPFDLTNSMYRVSTIRSIINESKNIIRIPNDLESIGVHYLNKEASKMPNYSMFLSTASSAALALNLTQNLYHNPIQGNIETTVEKLEQLYIQGKRIDWRSLANLQYNDCFLPKKYFIMV